MIDSFFGSLPDFLEFVMRYGSILAVIVVPLAVYIVFQKTKNETNKARVAAEKLGLRFINIADDMNKSTNKDSFLQKFLSAWSTWGMEGIYNELRVRIELMVKSRQQSYIPFSDRVSVSNPTTTSYSRGLAYTVSFKKPLLFDISVLQKIKMPFGLQTQLSNGMKTGDEELDRLVTISGSDANKINDWLNFPRRKETLKKLFQALPYVLIDNNQIHYRDSITRPDFDRINKNLTILCEAVHKLEE